MLRTVVVDFINSALKDSSILALKYDNIVFEERVKLACYHCPKYRHEGRGGGIKKWTCPPLPPIDFKMVLAEYADMLLVFKSFQNESHIDIRRESSVILHKTLLETEKFLWDNGCFLHATFIGGSCKLCKDGCNTKGCINPSLSRIPLEALGINVIKTSSNLGVDLSFRTKQSITRVGLICW